MPDEDNTPLVNGMLEPLPSGLPAGAPISIIIKISAEGFMSIDAKDETGGRTVHMEVQLQNVMTEQMVDEAKTQVNTMTLRN